MDGLSSKSSNWLVLYEQQTNYSQTLIRVQRWAHIFLILPDSSDAQHMLYRREYISDLYHHFFHYLPQFWHPWSKVYIIVLERCGHLVSTSLLALGTCTREVNRFYGGLEIGRGDRVPLLAYRYTSKTGHQHGRPSFVWRTWLSYTIGGQLSL